MESVAGGLILVGGAVAAAVVLTKEEPPPPPPPQTGPAEAIGGSLGKLIGSAVDFFAGFSRPTKK